MKYPVNNFFHIRAALNSKTVQSYVNLIFDFDDN